MDIITIIPFIPLDPGVGNFIIAQIPAVSDINNVSIKMEEAYSDLVGLCYAIAAVIALLGAIKVYRQWNHGEGNISTTILAWGGSCIFMVMAAAFVKALMH